MSPKARSQLAIFDCDGVLVDSEPISGRVLSVALNDLGLTLSPQEAAKRFLGPRLPEVMAAIEVELGKELDQDWLPRFEADRAAAFGKELLPMPGVASALARICGAGLPVCVASQGGLEITRHKLRAADLSRFFPDTAIFSAQEVGRGKPDPDLFLYAAAAMGVAPELCAVIEDTPRGVAAGLRAGMRVFEFTGKAGVLASSEAAAALGFFDDLPGLLGIS